MKLFISIGALSLFLSCGEGSFFSAGSAGGSKKSSFEDGSKMGSQPSENAVPGNFNNPNDPYGSSNDGKGSPDNNGDDLNTKDQNGFYIRTASLTGYENSDIASIGKDGTMIVKLLIQNLRQNDSNIKAGLSIHTSDFSSIEMKDLERVNSAKGAAYTDYKVTIQLKYKAVPDVTKYKFQKYEITYSSADGKSGRFEKPFHMVVTPEGASSGASVQTELEGTAGHPNSL